MLHTATPPRASTLGVSRSSGLHVLVVDDDRFTRTLVSGALSGSGYAVCAVGCAAAALDALRRDDFHAVVTDLDLGAGPSGADLLDRVAAEWPWIAMVVLTSHASPRLAAHIGRPLPEETVYLVKSDLSDFRLLSTAVAQAVRGGAVPELPEDPSRAAVTSAQADVLRMLASGMSTAGIARSRSTSLRAAEMMLHRLYEKLGLRPDAERDPRTSAVLMWQQGRVRVS